MKVTSMSIERRYSDDSGVEFGVELRGGEVSVISCADKATFPAYEIEWYIAALNKLRVEIFKEGE